MFSILVHAPSERQVRPIVDVAVGLAVTGRSHVDAVSVGYESVSIAAGIVADGGGAAVASVMGVQHDLAMERANAAIAVFEVEAKLARVAYGTHAFAAIPAEGGERLGELARLYDLTVVLQPDRSVGTYDNDVPQQILFNSGGPMLMVPYTQKGPLDARHIGIAWDGSRLAARALRDAAPFLIEAESLTIIAINEEVGEASSKQLVAHLARRGLQARTERLTVDRSAVQSAILSIAAETDMGLLVMGAYGHSRLQERILGGVTRSMFEAMTVPVLMSH
jgi:nucleotide-binding universal stress UspA family protein